MKVQLQQLRKAKGLTQEEIANILDVKLSTYQKYERDAISPPYDTLIKIADFYGVTTDYLLGREPKKEKPYHEGLEDEIKEAYISLPKEVRAQILQAMLDAVMSYSTDNPPAVEMRQSTMVDCGTIGEELERRQQETEALRKDTA